MDEKMINNDELIEEISCKSCGNPQIEEGYEFPLCHNCRNILVKRPVPRWIKLVFGLIMLVLIFALVNFPIVLKAGIAFERGQQAEKAFKYTTALNEYKKVEKTFPNSTLLLERLSIVSYKNNLYYDTFEYVNQILGRQASDEKTVEDINNIMETISLIYNPGEELLEIIQKNTNTKPENLLLQLEPYISKHPEDIYGLYFYANILFDLERYAESKKIMINVMERVPDFNPGNLFLATIYREMGQFDLAINCCQIELDKNIEDADAFSSLARIELKRFNDQMGLDIATKAFDLKNNSINAMTTLALAYHYTNQIAERDQLVKQIKESQDFDKDHFEFYQSLFDGKIQWR